MTRRPAPSSLRPDEVQIQVAELDAPDLAASNWFSLLSEGERARAGRYRFDLDRDRFIVRRGILRTLLGGYLESAPESVGLIAGAYGKPGLAMVSDSPQLSFNLSHSGGIALLAFSWNRRIGVDVERVRRDLDHGSLAERFFAPGERSALRRVDPADVPDRFFACWTRKEAVVKAHGMGLSLPLDAFEVSIGPTPEPSIIWKSPDPAERWRMLTLHPRPGLVGAVAVEGALWTAQPVFDFVP